MRQIATLLVVALVFVTAGCGGGGGSDSLSGSTSYSVHGSANNLLIVVEDDVSEGITPALDAYAASLNGEGIATQTMVWQSGTASQLREAIKDYHAATSLGSVLFLGDLPAAWYEQTADFGSSGSFFEQFPCDIYFMSLYSTWSDANHNGAFDSHSALQVDVPLSRVTGDSETISSYLNRVVDYRQNGSFLPQGAFIFKDDDWENYRKSNDFRLYDIYRSLTIYESAASTTRAGYSGYMSAVGTEFIYQWIHSSPGTLYFEVDGSYQLMSYSEVKAANVRGSFFNLYDCSAARFTEANLGSTYLHSDFGLAVFGTTKTGGVYEPYYFHRPLATGKTWGESFATWYNSAGRHDDNWYLGMAIQGCPFLKVAGATAKALTADMPPEAPAAIDMAILQENAIKSADDGQSSFAAYKANHKHYF